MKQSSLFSLEQQSKLFEQYRFGAMTLMLTFQSCWGSIAALFALKIDNTTFLITSAALTMASNAMFIAQAPSKWCLGTFYASILINGFLILLIQFM